MGIDVVRLNADQDLIRPRLTPADFAQPSFKTFHLPSPSMSIWLMTLRAGTPAFPWWNYAGALEEDLTALNQQSNISSQQGLFDYLALSYLTKFAGSTLYAILPGCIKTMGWGALRPVDRETFTRGQACVYHLFGNYDTNVNINWVPFWEPQSIVRNPNFESLWRLFVSNTGDETSRCLTLFSLSNPRRLPEVINLLINKDSARSNKLVSLVDWFGMYTSPMDPKKGTCAVVYTQH
jgi:hypothetical protein